MLKTGRRCRTMIETQNDRFKKLDDGWEDSGNMDDAYKAGSTIGWNACRDAILSAMKGGGE